MIVGRLFYVRPGNMKGEKPQIVQNLMSSPRNVWDRLKTWLYGPMLRGNPSN